MRKVKQSKKHIYWTLQFFGWAAFCSVNLLSKYLWTKNLSVSDLSLSVFTFGIAILCSHTMRWVFKRYNWASQDLRLILHKVGIVAIFSAAVNLFLLNNIVNACPQNVHHSFGFFGLTQLMITFSIAYFVWGLLYFMVYFFTNFKKAEIINLQNKALMTEAHLNKLKSQLNPHFMFNAMNVIRALIDEDKQKAKDGITKLSHILRHTLNVNNQRLIDIQEEIEIIEDYLSLEKMRFEERLDWSIKVSQEHRKFKLPPLLLQTIVENGIKHGISNEIKGGTVTIHSNDTPTGIVICVRNPGQYKENNETKGFGLKNSRERLNHIFEGRAELQISNLNEQEVETCIFLPKHYEL